MDQRGYTVHALSVIAGVLGVLLVLAYLGYIDLGPAGSGVDFYFVYSDGRIEPVKSGQSFTVYPHELKLYKDAGLSQEIAGVRGSLWLEPDTGGEDATIVIDYTTVGVSTDPVIGVMNSTGPYTSEEIPSNTRTSGLKTKEIKTSAFMSFATEGQYEVKWSYAGTGTIKNTSKSATWSTQATMLIWHKGTTLSITAGVAQGSFSIQ